jgi:hypothetical protein
VPAPVYSTLFIAARGVSVDASYVVPAGMLAIVRDVVFVFDEAPDNTAADVIDANTHTIIAYCLAIDPFQFFHLDCRQVVPAGGRIEGSSGGPGDVSIRVSGYLLTLP